MKVTHPPMIGDAVINDCPGLLLIVEKFPWGNTLEVTQGVEAALAELKPALAGIEVDSTIFRPATFIETAIDNLTMSLLIGAVLLIVVLVAFLYNWRVALISLIAMPLSLVAAWLVLYWRGASINTPDGGHVWLAEVADVRIVPTPNVIKREAVSRRLDVSANVKDRDLGSVAREVEQRLQGIEFPREYHPVVLGEYAERQAAESRLLYLALAAALGIFLLLQASFGSWRLTILSFLTLPWALVGGVLAAFASDGIVSLGSLVGFLTVLGIAARNGIMLISHYQHLEAVEGMPFGPELVMRGAKERLAPILMTGATTGLSLIPLIVAGNIPGHEIEHPMAIVILGGLLTSTLLNLFVVPALYLRFGKGNTPLPSTNVSPLPLPAGAA